MDDIITFSKKQLTARRCHVFERVKKLVRDTPLKIDSRFSFAGLKVGIFGNFYNENDLD